MSKIDSRTRLSSNMSIQACSFVRCGMGEAVAIVKKELATVKQFNPGDKYVEITPVSFLPHTKLFQR